MKRGPRATRFGNTSRKLSIPRALFGGKTSKEITGESAAEYISENLISAPRLGQAASNRPRIPIPNGTALRAENGPIALVELNPDAYKEISRFDQPDRSRAKAWPHPVVSNGILYIRDQGILLAFDLRK